MPRLGVVCRDVRAGTGATRVILEHARRTVAAGWEVDVIGSRLDEEGIRAAGARPVKMFRWSRPLFAYFAGRRAASYDLVHGHGDHYVQDVLSLHNCVHAAHEAVHGKPHPGDGVAAVHAKLLTERRFRLLICNSQLTRTEVTARFGVPNEMMRVIYPAVDTTRFKPEGPSAREELGFKPDDFVVGLITSGDFAKRGVDVFRAAMAKLPHLKSVVVGKGPGALPPVPDVERYYRALDLYVHPAHWEEFGLSVAEALACGVPVLTTRKVGASEIMGPGHQAILLDRSSPEELAAAIDLLHKNPDRLEALREEGPRSVARYTWESSFKRTLSCYEALLKK